MTANTIDAGGILHRIRGEFLEMPGLCLTAGQAHRLRNLDAAACDALLQALVAAEIPAVQVVGALRPRRVTGSGVLSQ